MARIVVRPDLAGTTHMVAMPPVVKVKNVETGEIALDRDGVTPLYVVQLVETYEATVQLIKVTVPETGIPDGLLPGALVRPVGLLAAPWGNHFNGQVTVGLSYRADALESLTPTMAVGAKSAPASAEK